MTKTEKLYNTLIECGIDCFINKKGNIVLPFANMYIAKEHKFNVNELDSQILENNNYFNCDDDEWLIVEEDSIGFNLIALNGKNLYFN